MEKVDKLIIAGKRKTAFSKLRLKPGTGKIFFNYLSHTELNLFHKLALSEPIRIFDREIGGPIKFDFYIKTLGGGKEAQIEASRLAIARAFN